MDEELSVEVIDGRTSVGDADADADGVSVSIFMPVNMGPGLGVGVTAVVIVLRGSTVEELWPGDFAATECASIPYSRPMSRFPDEGTPPRCTISSPLGEEASTSLASSSSPSSLSGLATESGVRAEGVGRSGVVMAMMSDEADPGVLDAVDGGIELSSGSSGVGGVEPESSLC